MKTFKVNVTRTQIQSQTFVVKAKSQFDLEMKLDNIDFGEMDSLFDEGEVDSIDYEVNEVEPCKKYGSTFADEDLQECLDNI
jgi:hypothetical protein